MTSEVRVYYVLVTSRQLLVRFAARAVVTSTVGFSFLPASGKMEIGRTGKLWLAR